MERKKQRYHSENYRFESDLKSSILGIRHGGSDTWHQCLLRVACGYPVTKPWTYARNFLHFTLRYATWARHDCRQHKLCYGTAINACTAFLGE